MNASIRNIALASGLTLVSLLGLATTVKAQSATSSSWLEVKVNEVCVINGGPGNWTQASNFASISTSQAGTINVTCNAAKGFEITAYSANGGKLLPADPVTNTDFIPYTIAGTGGGTSTAAAVAAFTPPLPASPAQVATTGYVSTCATACTVPVSFALTLPSALRADTYNDSVTFTIATN